MFWRTTVKEKQLPISKHNNQAKFPRGQLMCQLYPNVTWGKLLLIMRFGKQTVTWRSCTVHKERDRYCSRYQVLKHYSFSDIGSLKNIQGNLRIISKMHTTVLNKCLPKKSMDSTVTRSTERAVRLNETQGHLGVDKELPKRKKEEQYSGSGKLVKLEQNSDILTCSLS